MEIFIEEFMNSKHIKQWDIADDKTKTKILRKTRDLNIIYPSSCLTTALTLCSTIKLDSTIQVKVHEGFPKGCVTLALTKTIKS